MHPHLRRDTQEVMDRMPEMQAGEQDSHSAHKIQEPHFCLISKFYVRRSFETQDVSPKAQSLASDLRNPAWHFSAVAVVFLSEQPLQGGLFVDQDEEVKPQP